MNDKIKDLRQKIETSKTVLENANPQTILERGYSMVTDENGTVIRDSASIKIDNNLIIRPANGKIFAKTTGVEK